MEEAVEHLYAWARDGAKEHPNYVHDSLRNAHDRLLAALRQSHALAHEAYRCGREDEERHDPAKLQNPGDTLAMLADLVLQAAGKCDPPLTEADIETCGRSIERWILAIDEIHQRRDREIKELKRRLWNLQTWRSEAHREALESAAKMLEAKAIPREWAGPSEEFAKVKAREDAVLGCAFLVRNHKVTP